MTDGISRRAAVSTIVGGTLGICCDEFAFGAGRRRRNRCTSDAPQPLPRTLAWSNQRRPPYERSNGDIKTDSPGNGSVSHDRSNGQLTSFTSFVQPDPSGDGYSFQLAWFEWSGRNPESITQLWIVPRWRMNSSASLHIVDRSGLSSLDFEMVQIFWARAWRWDGTNWVDLGRKTSRWFRERRYYRPGQGGNDTRNWSWPNVTRDDSWAWDARIAAGQHIAMQAGIHSWITYASSRFSVTASNNMRVTMQHATWGGR